MASGPPRGEGGWVLLETAGSEGIIRFLRCSEFRAQMGRSGRAPGGGSADGRSELTAPGAREALARAAPRSTGVPG